MKLLSLLALTAGAAAGYVLARRILDDPDLPERLPQRAQRPARIVRERLELARERALAIADEANRARREAEDELMRDYYGRVGRPDDLPSQPASNGV